MESKKETDIEVINAAGKHELYTVALVNVASALEKNALSMTDVDELALRAKELRAGLVRCGVEYDVRTDFDDPREIRDFLGSSRILLDVGNKLVDRHGPQQEKFWIIACLISSATTATMTGRHEHTSTLRPHIDALAAPIGLQAVIVDACLREGLQPLRDWVVGQGAVFIGHGRASVWRDLKDLLTDRLGLDYVEFNSASPAGLATQQRLEEVLQQSSFAFLVLTAEDQHVDGSTHARENVIHEVGLFQGRLGFRKAVVLLEDGCEPFSNIAGLGQIRFPPQDLLAKSEEIRAVLEREGML